MPIIKAPVTFPTATSGGASLGSNFTFTSTSYGDSGLNVSLPAAGTYLILGTVNFLAQITSGSGAIDVQLYNTTAGAAVASSDRRCGGAGGATDGANRGTAGLAWLVTVGASSTVRLEAKRTTLSAPTWATSELYATYTRLDYVKLSS